VRRVEDLLESSLVENTRPPSYNLEKRIHSDHYC